MADNIRLAFRILFIVVLVAMFLKFANDASYCNTNFAGNTVTEMPAWCVRYMMR